MLLRGGEPRAVKTKVRCCAFRPEDLVRKIPIPDVPAGAGLLHYVQVRSHAGTEHRFQGLQRISWF